MAPLLRLSVSKLYKNVDSCGLLFGSSDVEVGERGVVFLVFMLLQRERISSYDFIGIELCYSD